MILVKLFMFFVSNIGFWEVLNRKTNISIYFLPILTVAIQALILLFAGIINCLRDGAAIIYIFGIVMLINYRYKERSFKFLNKYINTGEIFFVFSFILMAIILKDKLFIHYDNFSHWAIVVKKIVEENRLPNFQDNVIMFKQYPLGSSVWIYYFSKFTGNLEWIYMLSQNYIVLSCILPVFFFIKEQKRLTLLMVILFTNIFVQYNISVVDLLVDTLLPLAGASLFLFAYTYSNDKKYLPLIVIFMTWVLQIKNSGVFFVFLVSSLLLWKYFINRNRNYILSAVLPYISIYLWNRHCQYVFDNASISKHAMTVSNYGSVFSQKSTSDFMVIVKNYTKFLLHYNNSIELFLVGVGILIALLFGYNKYKNIFKKFIFCCFGLIIIYSIGTICMYLFSMPTGEALCLASVDRYVNSLFLFIMYFILTIILICINSGTNKIKQKVAVLFTFSILCCFNFCVMSRMNFPKGYLEAQSTVHPRIWLSNVKNNYSIPTNSSYCFVGSYMGGDTDLTGYFYFLSGYLFNSRDVLFIKQDKDENQDKFIAKLNNINKKYILICDKNNKLIQSWIREKFPNQCYNDAFVVNKK